ncbi:MAG: hypothetical protein WCK75_11605 [Elusimicrobiota bacterium]
MTDKIIKTLLVSILISPMAVLYAGEQLSNNKATFTKSEASYARTDPDYFTINPASIKITRLEATEEKDFTYLGPLRMDVGGALIVIDQIINIATKIWDIVKQNAPVVEIDTKYATAVPQGITAWNQLSEWKRPKSYIYGFYAENLYGAKTIDVKYKVLFTPGGKYKGKGLYLTGVTVIPAATNVSWGYRFSLSAQVPDSTIANIGTDIDPVASLQLTSAWKIGTPVKESNGTSVYYIQGDGYFEEIASPFAREEVKIENVKSAAPLSDPAGVF